MRTKTLLNNLIICLLITNYCICDDENPHQNKLIRIYPINNKQLDQLKEIENRFEIRFWKVPQNNLIPILAEIEPSNYEVLQYFNSSNIRYEIVTKDLQEFIENQRFLTNSQLKNKFDYDYTYHRYNQIVKELRDFETKYSNLTQIVRIGKSTEGRKIFAIILNNKSNKISKKNVIIECGIHAREWISIATCLWISNQLVSNNTDRILLDRYEFIIIPSLNPDGYEYTWTTNRLWRKTRSKSKKSECIGTDLNRNWNSSFCRVGASAEPCQDDYCGDFPFSEPETKSMRKFLRKRKTQILAYFSIHSYSQLWLYPLGHTNKLNRYSTVLGNFSELATNAIYKIHNQTYEYGSISSVISPISGSSVDWVFEKLGVKLCFALELRDDGFYGFLLPPEFIKPTAEEVWAGIKVIDKH